MITRQNATPLTPEDAGHPMSAGQPCMYSLSSDGLCIIDDQGNVVKCFSTPDKAQRALAPIQMNRNIRGGLGKAGGGLLRKIAGKILKVPL
jgi:hypothetical protein